MSEDQEAMDLCECVFSHEFAMRRLLNLLRNGQTVCTDNECTDLVLPQNNASTGGEIADNFTWMIFAMIAAVILYLIRPSSLRRRNDDLNKPSRDDHNDPQPPMAN